MDAGPQTGLILLWGADPLYLMGGMRKESIRSAISNGAKLVVINPKRIHTSQTS